MAKIPQPKPGIPKSTRVDPAVQKRLREAAAKEQERLHPGVKFSTAPSEAVPGVKGSELPQPIFNPGVPLVDDDAKIEKFLIAYRDKIGGVRNPDGTVNFSMMYYLAGMPLKEVYGIIAYIKKLFPNMIQFKADKDGAVTAFKILGV